MNIFKKALVASVAAGMLAAGPAGVMVASAQGNFLPEAREVDLNQLTSLVSSHALTDLVIHKHEGPDGTEGNGLKQTVDAGKVQGAGFTVRKAPEGEYNLRTNEGWKAAYELQKRFRTQEESLTSAAMAEAAAWPVVKPQQETNGEGETTFDDLPAGLYFVEETKPADDYNVSVPFVIALPMTHPESRDQRLETVHVYPKNYKRGTPKKTVNDQFKNAGDVIDYTITMQRPVGNKMKKFIVGDQYDSTKLEYKGASVEHQDRVVVQIGEPGPTNPPLVKDVDYQVEESTLPVPGSPSQKLVNVTLTATGLGKFTSASSNDKIAVTLPFEVKPQGEDAFGVVDNSFDIRSQADEEFDPGKPGSPENPKNPPYRPETPTKSYFGNAKIVKTGPNSEKLRGAEFNVYRCASTTALFGEPLQLLNPDGRTKTERFVTDEKGEVLLRGLHVNDFENGDAKTASISKYCLVETKSPEGKALLAEPIEFEILHKGSESVQLVSINVENVDSNGGFRLPLTGGTGIYLLLAAGGVFLLIGGGYYLKQQRRRS